MREAAVRLKKIPTGVSGLDQIIDGGLLQGGVYLVQGEPGTGKTILGNQICFNRVAAGKRVTYVTLLAESHARMIQHMECFSFYNEKSIPSAMHYISAFDALANDGLAGVINVLDNEIRQRKADMVVLDGLVTATGASGSPQDLKLFVSQIQALSALTGCTTLLLNSLRAVAHTTPEQTMVDGIFMLRQELVGSRHERTLEVRKFRGARILHGAHTFRIGEQGLVVFPQLEAVRAPNHTRIALDKRISTGVPGLDEMLGGGYPLGSATAISGEEGTGKTLSGLQFLAQASAGEPALLFGLDESSEMAEAIASAFGIEWERLRHNDLLHTAWRPFFGESLDEIGYRLLDAVKRTGARRLFIDGLAAMTTTPAYAERGASFFAALFLELRRLETTTLFSVQRGHGGTEITLPNERVSPLADNTVLLAVEVQDHRAPRSVSIGKVRGGRPDLAIRELLLTPSGLRVGEVRGARDSSAE
jgi:circadian clock protein KaiC